MTAILSLLVKSSLVLLVAAAADAALRRRGSAAARHLLWTCALFSLLLLPLATWSLPRWDVAITVAPAAVPADAVAGTAAPQASMVDAADDAAPLAQASATPPVAAQPSRPFPWLAAAFAVYLSGVVLLLVRMVAERMALRGLTRGAEAISTADWTALEAECLRATRCDRPIRLLRTLTASTPMAFGVWRPVILLPAVADEWSTDRRRAVLLHEMAHVARRDCLTQTMAAVVCAAYWIHPGVWWAARRLRVERELACDDRVLAAGTPARDYAGHLLEIAYALGRRRTPSLAVAMARPAQLEGRMLAVLDSRRKRSAPRLAGRFAMGAATAALLMPLASLDAHVAAPSAIPNPVTIGAAIDVPSSVRTVVKRPEQRRAEESTDGTWELRQSEQDGVVHLRMTRGQSSHGFSIALSKFEGLTAAQLSGSGGPVRFLLRRDAGTITFEGTTRNGVGGGTYSFAANPAFASELDKRGFGRPTVAQQFELARADIGAAFLDELNSQQYTRPDLAQLVRAGSHGAGLDYLRGMGQAGYHVGSVDTLVELRDHGVTPDYIRGLADAGYTKLPADDLRRMRDHGVTPEYIRGLADAGYKGLAADALVRVRDHGVTPEYVRALRDAGFTSVPIDEVVRARDHGVTSDFIKGLGDLAHGQSLDALIRLRDHGVTPEYISGMREMGYSASPEELTKARDHGVTPEYVRGMTALGYRNIPLEQMIRMRDHGVTPEYAKSIRDLGYTEVDADMLVHLRDRGVTAERIRRANERAGTRLPLDMIERLVL